MTFGGIRCSGGGAYIRGAGMFVPAPTGSDLEPVATSPTARGVAGDAGDRTLAPPGVRGAAWWAGDAALLCGAARRGELQASGDDVSDVLGEADDEKFKDATAAERERVTQIKHTPSIHHTIH